MIDYILTVEFSNGFHLTLCKPSGKIAGEKLMREWLEYAREFCTAPIVSATLRMSVV